MGIPGQKMKNSKPHIVPLARQVVELLENLRRYTGEGRYLFPSWGKEGHLTTNALLKANQSRQASAYRGMRMGL